MNRIHITTLALFALSACGDGDATELADAPEGHLAVTQGGAQDIEHFRQVLEDGEVPDLDTFDQLGFFAEHAMDQPPADCGHSICVHPQLAVAPRFDGGNWTMAFASFNTPVTADTRERDPVHLAVVAERRTDDDALLDGVAELVDALPADDAVTMVAFTRDVAVLHDAQPASDAGIAPLRDFAAGDGAALYDALALAIDRIEHRRGSFPEARILLVTSGHATRGITDAERIVALGEGAARAGIGMSIVGIGEDYDASIPQQLAELGTATLAYAGDDAELEALLAAQGELTLVPLATDFELRITPATGYLLGQVFGAQRAYRDGDAMVLAAPGLFLGARTGSSDTGGMLGRRGGGGGVFVRLWAEDDSAVAPGEPAFTAEVRYHDRDAGQDVSYERVVRNALAPGEIPNEFWPHFSHEEYAKPFMMLNMWLAIAYSLELYEEGSCAESMGVSDMMGDSVRVWQERFDDPDIEADAELLRQVADNVDLECVSEPVPPAMLVDAGCFGT